MATVLTSLASDLCCSALMRCCRGRRRRPSCRARSVWCAVPSWPRPRCSCCRPPWTPWTSTSLPRGTAAATARSCDPRCRRPWRNWRTTWRSRRWPHNEHWKGATSTTASALRQRPSAGCSSWRWRRCRFSTPRTAWDASGAKPLEFWWVSSCCRPFFWLSPSSWRMARWHPLHRNPGKPALRDKVNICDEPQHALAVLGVSFPAWP
mmetsp:Transcript_20811/g.45766  ORF Transcript_20811/g.45766 Transcript_20811/m.45766 type:complete len:207 (+) Transcript_20811:596-1216(+)